MRVKSLSPRCTLQGTHTCIYMQVSACICKTCLHACARHAYQHVIRVCMQILGMLKAERDLGSIPSGKILGSLDPWQHP